MEQDHGHWRGCQFNMLTSPRSLGFSLRGMLHKGSPSTSLNIPPQVFVFFKLNLSHGLNFNPGRLPAFPFRSLYLVLSASNSTVSAVIDPLMTPETASQVECPRW